MAYIGWATHVPQGLNQRAATAKATATPNDSLSSNCVLQPARMKLKPLVIVHQHVTVKITQALHTPPITPGECIQWEALGCRQLQSKSSIAAWAIWVKLTQGSGRGTCCWITR